MRAFAAAFLLTIAIELPVLAIGLHRRHALRDRVVFGLWLSAATLPVVWFVLPPLIDSRTVYLLVAETFAPAAEVGLLFGAVAMAGRQPLATAARDAAAVVAANLLSFGVGSLVW